MALVGRILTGALFVAYPILVWIGLRQGSPRRVALILLAVLIPIGIVRLRKGGAQAALGPIVAVGALGLAAWLDRQGWVLAVPVAINAVFLIGFSVTLRRGVQPMVERFARLQEPDLTPEQQAWCRLWTKIWCAFFLLNGSTALVLALAAPLSWWAFYNGLLAYVLIGSLFACEWILRRRRFPQNS